MYNLKLTVLGISQFHQFRGDLVLLIRDGWHIRNDHVLVAETFLIFEKVNSLRFINLFLSCEIYQI